MKQLCRTTPIQYYYIYPHPKQQRTTQQTNKNTCEVKASMGVWGHQLPQERRRDLGWGFSTRVWNTRPCLTVCRSLTFETSFSIKALINLFV